MKALTRIRAVGQFLAQAALKRMAVIFVERTFLDVIPGDALGVGRLYPVLDASFPEGRLQS